MTWPSPLAPPSPPSPPSPPLNPLVTGVAPGVGVSGPAAQDTVSVTTPGSADHGLRTRFVTNTLVQIVAPVVRIGFSVGLTAMLSRYLGVSGYGQYGLAFAYVAIFGGIFANWGLTPICVREISRRPQERTELLLSAAALQAVISLGTYVALVVGLTIVKYPLEVEEAALVYGLTIMLLPMDILALTFQADLRLSKLLAPSLAGIALHFALSVAVILLKGSIAWLMAAAVLALAAQYAWISTLAIQSLRRPSLPTTVHWVPLLRESWPLALATVAATAFGQVPTLALSVASVDAIGLYNAANKVPQQLSLLPIAVRGTAFPLLSQSWANDLGRFQRLLDRLVSAALLVAVPVTLIGIGASGPIVGLLFGPSFGAAVQPFAILIASFAILCPGILIGEAMIAAGAQHLSLAILTASLVLFLVLLYLWVPSHGAVGAAWAYVVTQLANLIATAMVLSYRAKVPLARNAIAPGVLSMAVGGGVLLATSPLGSIPSSGLAAVAAALTLVALRPRVTMELWREAVALVARRS